ncbi:hypothetical protein HDU97_009642 [Phlyctochytrium planicorne]|nr:hypothetical protein HDU97_009642 [Phlyctochytrium planicorne]
MASQPSAPSSAFPKRKNFEGEGDDVDCIKESTQERVILISETIPAPSIKGKLPTKILSHFDGLRGLCAFGVYIHHIQHHVHYYLDIGWSNRIISSMAVAIFFVLSGRVLLISYMKRKDNVILANATVKRFFRLFFPVLFVIAMDRTIQHHGIYAHSFALLNAQNQRLGLFIGYHVLNQPTSWYDIVRDSMNVFNASIAGIPMSAMWTLYYEYMGSLMLYLVGMVVNNLPDPSHRWIVYAIAFFSHFMTYSWVMLFIAGAIIGDMAQNSHFTNLRTRSPRLNLIIVSAMGFFVCFIIYKAHLFYASYFHAFTNFFRIYRIEASPEDVDTYAGITIVLMLEMSPFLQRTFSNVVFEFLGKISFMLYLSHGVFLSSLYPYILSAFLAANIDPTFSSYTAIIIHTAFLLAFCWVAYLYVDKKSVRLSSRIGDAIIGARRKSTALSEPLGADGKPSTKER